MHTICKQFCVTVLILSLSLGDVNGATDGYIHVLKTLDAYRNVSPWYQIGYGLRDSSYCERAMFVAEEPGGYANKTSNYAGGFGAPQSMADDFIIPAGYTTRSIMLAIGSIRAWSTLHPEHPKNITFGIFKHDPVADAPDTSIQPLLWITKNGPIGDWHNMTLDWWFGVPWSDCVTWKRVTTGNPIAGFWDWFELDVSAANGGTGLSGGHYWISIAAAVGVYGDYYCPTNNAVTGNAYSILNAASSLIDPARGSNARMTKWRMAPSYYAPGQTTWTIGTGCALFRENSPTAQCNLALNIYIRTAVNGTEPDLISVSLPPPVCTVNVYAYAASFNSTSNPGTASSAPDLACPGPYASIVGAAATPTPTPHPTGTPTAPAPTTPPTPQPPVPTPTSTGSAHTIVQLVVVYCIALLIIWTCLEH